LFGVLTRLSAVGGTIIMLVAYFSAHLSNGFFTLSKEGGVTGINGELALLYLAVFLIVLAHGAGKWSLEKKFFKKELLW